MPTARATPASWCGLSFQPNVACTVAAAGARSLLDGSSVSAQLPQARFSTRNLRGRLFWKRRPKMIPIWKFNTKSKWLEGVGCRKGVCTKVFVQPALKPNSGLRKVCYVRLSNARIVKAYIPGIGHNLQVHSVVMVRGGAKKDTTGAHYTCMRGKYDLLPVKNRKSSRSKYGVVRPNKDGKKPGGPRFKHVTTSVDRRLAFYKTGVEVSHDEDPDAFKNDARFRRFRVLHKPPNTYRHVKPVRQSR